ncbi:exonuclease domain-containing protein [Falsibacillus albus]|uniref:DNA polymerase III subunit epsilon n=1 Tax=Falsibacillus albus TaxID=2478915 RepID=A0A3L7K3U6_9BACI|nr:exonuclease domain-containing protein [Falsibacillus albus]RLQ97500.1 DNA polymerase III subunit epsilon [Falsibacillus albus]
MAQNEKIGIVLDVETTGLSPHTNEIIELFMIKFSFDQKTGRFIETLDEYSTFNEPSSSISSQITRLTGITNEMVKGASLDLGEILDFCSDVEYFFAHNASFDRSFIIKVMPELVHRKWHCSMRHVKWKNHGFPNMKLGTLLDGHGILNDQAHRANSDTRSTLELMLKTNSAGHTYLKEMTSRKPMALPASMKTGPSGQTSKYSYRRARKMAEQEMAASREKKAPFRYQTKKNVDS